MSARWGYEVKVGGDDRRGYRDARTRTVVPRRVLGVVRTASRLCAFDALFLRVPLLIIAFQAVRLGIAFNVGQEHPSAIVLPTLMVAPGALLVLGMIVTGLLLGLRLPYASRAARLTKSWLRGHQVLVAVALPLLLLVLEGPCLVLPALALTLAVTRIVWWWSERLAIAALAIEELDAQSG